MSFKNLAKKTRSCRRFYGDCEISKDVLKELVECARVSPSAANLQPLRYMLFADSKSNNLIFPNLSWAGYLKDWPGPDKEERPAAYIIVLAEKQKSRWSAIDFGIAAQSILLAAAEKGFASCIIGALDKSNLIKQFNIKPIYEIMAVIALGRPKEKIIIDDVINDNVEYYRDSRDIHHVPKRKLEDIILE